MKMPHVSTVITPEIPEISAIIYAKIAKRKTIEVSICELWHKNLHYLNNSVATMPK